MSRVQRTAEAVTANARVVAVALLLLTALVGAGLTMIETDASLDQFQDDSPETQAQEYVDELFVDDESENTTAAQVVVTGDNVMTKASLIESLEFQQEIRANESINATLVEDDPIVGIENVLAMSAITEEEIDEIEDQADELEERSDAVNETRDRAEEGLNESRELQRAFEEEMLEAGLEEGDEEYEQRAEELEADVEEVFESVTDDEVFDDAQRNSYEQSMNTVRTYEAQLVEYEEEYGESYEEEARYRQTLSEMDDIYGWATTTIFGVDFNRIGSEAHELEQRIEELEEGDQRPIDEQIAALEALDDEEFEELIVDTIDGEGPRANEMLGFLPSSYELGSTDADARMTVLLQETEDAGGVEIGVTDERVIQSQLELRELAAAYEGDTDEEAAAGGETATGHEYIVFGGGIIESEIDQSMADTLWIVGPFTLLFVVGALAVAYRDPIDIVLGTSGIIAVLVWTFGLVGWIGIPFNLLFAAIPVLLVGLSVDYALHVFMRHRERRLEGGAGPDGVRRAMAIALAGVGAALVWITATTAMAFIANAVSPLGVLREFGIVGAIGIVSALIVFGGLIPALKVEIDSALEARGYSRRKRAFGTGGGRFSRILSTGAVAARRAPLVVLLAVLLLTAGGVYGATQVDTTFEEEDFMPQSQPAWTGYLPGPMAPADYQAADDLDVINEHFHRLDSNAELLIQGSVSDDDAVERIADAKAAAAESDVVYTLPNGEADIVGPLSVMEQVAESDDSFNETYLDADTTDDGVPNQDVEEVYDQLFRADQEAASEVIHRTEDGEYVALRLTVAIEGDAAYAETAQEMRAIADLLDDGGEFVPAEAYMVTDEEEDETAGAGGGDTTNGGESAAMNGDDDSSAATGAWSATATGSPITNHIVEVDLFETVIETLIVAFVGAFVFLTVAYRVAGKSAALGAITLLPIALSVSWILGTMYLLDIPFNVLTVTVAALTIGLGVDYSIHITSRYTLELDRQGNVWDALHTTVTGTGGALLGSVATTMAAFATLGLGILPVFRQFGIVTGLTVGYAFLASVLVLPTLLVLWTRYVGSADISWSDTEGPQALAGADAVDQEVTSESVRGEPATDSSNGDTD
ncbi:MMPL family transporter [Halobacteria archaeon AArc-dxtr1]|nr:MMPL family transporter [Halobacteria archaeon AArc-dxtr1]